MYARPALKRNMFDTGYADPTAAAAVFAARKGATRRLPLFLNPAYDRPARPELFREGKMDLTDALVKNPESTFLIRVSGDSMIKAGINSGDILVVDRSLKPENDKVVVAEVNGRLLVKRLKIRDEGSVLVPENPKYPEIKITHDDEFNIWGVVVTAVKTL